MSNVDELVTSVVKRRKVTYYLTTEEDLNSVSSNSRLADLFVTVASLGWGACFSIELTKSTGIGLTSEVLSVLYVFSRFSLVVSIIFSLLAVLFFYRSWLSVRKIKHSGNVTSVDNSGSSTSLSDRVESNPTDKKLKILSAYYGSTEHKFDVTEQLRARLENNILEITASNDIAGDPHHGVLKTLIVDYTVNGLRVKKEFTEGDRVVLT
jgi:hypothetical protein